MLVRDHVAMRATRASHSAPPHRRRLHVQAGTGLAPTPPDKMPASRMIQIQPECSRDACLARAPHSAPPHKRRLHVQASTGLAMHPRRPIKCLHHDSDTARMLSRCVLSMSTPQRTTAQKTPARTGQYWPCTKRPPIKCLHHDSDTAQMLVHDHLSRCVLARASHSAAQYREACTCRPVLALHPRPPINCLHHDSDTAQMLVRDHVSRCVLARAPYIAPPHRRRLDVQASTGQYWPCTHAAR
jgi:hypothetical protein